MDNMSRRENKERARAVCLFEQSVLVVEQRKKLFLMHKKIMLIFLP